MPASHASGGDPSTVLRFKYSVSVVEVINTMPNGYGSEDRLICSILPEMSGVYIYPECSLNETLIASLAI